MANKNKEIKIANYATFQYVKQQLEQEILHKEETIKKTIADKIPFGIGTALLNPEKKEGGLKESIKKEVIANSLPLLKNLASTFLKTNKMRLVVWGIAIAGGVAIKVLIGNKLLKK